LRIIAEGVETEAQAEFLQRISCKEGQGYLYARPMGIDEFEAWVSERESSMQANNSGQPQAG